MEHQEQTFDKMDMSIWKDFFKLLIPYKSYFIKLIGINVLLGILDSSFPMFSKYAIDNFIAKGNMDGIGIYIGVYFLAIISISIVIYVFILATGKLETKMAYDIRKNGFEKLQELPLSYYDNKAVGWLMSRMTSDITRLSETISWGLVDFSWGITMMIGIVIYMLILNWKLALIVLVVIPPLAVISVYFQKRILIAQRGVRSVNSQITAAFNEDIQGAKTTKTMVREDINLEEFSKLTGSLRDKSIRATKLSSIYLPIVIGLGSVGTALAVTIGGDFILLEIMSYGTLVAFISYTAQFFEPVRQMAVIFAEVQAAQASAERVFSLLNEEANIFDKQEVIDQYGDMFSQSGKEFPDINGKVEFKDVSFSYNEGEEVLKNFNLEVNPGETIALVGETGSGKSTIVNLFCRFYEPVSGKIIIDGKDYKDMPIKWIHNNLGYVLQSPHLFSGTIKDNIKYGKLDATDDEVIEAAKLVKAHEFIIEMEKAYDTEVGEGGNLLSTGQKQLISFARAIIRKPKLFVLDEATSSIDTETEKIIQNAIQKVLEGRTSFVIAHRLSTIKNSDRILVIKDGEILEAGTHSELIGNKGYYYRLYTNQFMDEESKSILTENRSNN